MEDPRLLIDRPGYSVGSTTLVGMPEVVDLGLVRGVVRHAARVLDCWVLGIVVAGSMSVQVGDSAWLLREGNYYLLPKGVHHYGLDTSLFDALFVHFTLRVDDFRATVRTELRLAGTLPAQLQYLELFSFLDSNRRRSYMSAEQLGVQVLAVLQQLAANQHSRLQGGAAGPALAGRVMDILRREYGEDLSGREIAHRLGYTYAYLEKVFREEFAISIHQQLLRERIEAAALSLQMGKSIKQVAADVGFSDYYYFLKMFKRLKGISPGAFQQGFRGQAPRLPTGLTTEPLIIS